VPITEGLFEFGGIEGDEEDAAIFAAPRRMPAPPVPAPVAPIRTAPIPLPRPTVSVQRVTNGAVFMAPRPTPVSLVTNGDVFDPAQHMTNQAILAAAPPPRISVPELPAPCPPGFVRR